MIKRKIILSIFILIFLTINLVGCKNLSQQTKEDIYEDFQKKITKMTSYTCQADITVFNNKSQSKYTINHTYKKPSYYKLEIIKPENLNGKTIEYNKDKIIIKNKDGEVVKQTIGYIGGVIKSKETKTIITSIVLDLSDVYDIEYSY